MNDPGTHRTVGPPGEPIVGYSPPDAHPRLLDLEGKVNQMAGERKHMATKDDVTNAKLWMVMGIGAAITALIAAAAAIITVTVRILGSGP